MPSCAFNGCTNHSRIMNKSQSITFHSFPGDELLQHKWLIVVRKHRQEPHWTPNKHSRICSVHFKFEDMYTTNKGYRKLSKSAVPFFRAAMVAGNYTPPIPISPNSLNNVDISDLESEIFESPRKAFLKRKLRIEQMKNRKLMKNNKNLKKKVNRLTETCKNLKEALIQCKKVLNVTEDHFAELSFKAEAEAESVDLL